MTNQNQVTPTPSPTPAFSDQDSARRHEGNGGPDQTHPPTQPGTVDSSDRDRALADADRVDPSRTGSAPADTPDADASPSDDDITSRANDSTVEDADTRDAAVSDDASDAGARDDAARGDGVRDDAAVSDARWDDVPVAETATYQGRLVDDGDDDVDTVDESGLDDAERPTPTGPAAAESDVDRRDAVSAVDGAEHVDDHDGNAATTPTQVDLDYDAAPDPELDRDDTDAAGPDLVDRGPADRVTEPSAENDAGVAVVPEQRTAVYDAVSSPALGDSPLPAAVTDPPTPDAASYTAPTATGTTSKDAADVESSDTATEFRRSDSATDVQGSHSATDVQRSDVAVSQPATDGAGEDLGADAQVVNVPAGAPPADPSGELFAGLWPANEAEALRERWRELQLRFVDDPRDVAEEADLLVGQTVDTLTGSLATLRAELSGWRSDGSGDTEALRVAVQRYRQFLDHLLAL